MANLIAKVTARFDNASLEEALSDILLQESRKRKDRMRNSIKRRMRTLLKKHLKSHRVVLSIKGLGQQYSLAAEFGLTPEMAHSAADMLVKKISQAPRASIIEKKAGSQSRVEISILGLSNLELLEKIDTNNEPFSYVSIPVSEKSYAKTRTIKWMKLVLNPKPRLLDAFIPDVNTPLENTKKYGIVRGDFSGDQSRSGLAYMQLSYHPQNFPYTIPKEIIPTGRSSKNFIDDIIKSRSFTSAVREIIRDVVNREMGS